MCRVILEREREREYRVQREWVMPEIAYRVISETERERDRERARV